MLIKCLIWSIHLILKLLYFFLVILATLLKGEFVVHLHIMHFVLNIINILSNKLQMKTATLGQAANTIDGVIQTFEKSRNAESFLDLWESIEEFSKKHNINLILANNKDIESSVYCNIIIIDYFIY